MAIFQLYYKAMVFSLLLLSPFTSFGMELSRRQPKQQEGLGWNKTIVPLSRYSLDYMPQEMQVPIFCQSGLSFNDKRNLSLVNKASHQNIRENVLLYRTIPSRKMSFAIDAIIYVTDTVNNINTISCSII